MNIKKMKLALTVDLMNDGNSRSPISHAKSAMDNFSHETGEYKGSIEKQKSAISDEIEWSSLEMEFEHCTLSLDLIRDKKTKKEFLQSFNLHENLS